MARRAQKAAYNEIRAPRWGREEREYQIAKPRRPFVYHTGRNSALVHKIRVVRLRWWTTGPNGDYLVRLQSPSVLAVTNCGQWISISNTGGATCAIPKPDAVICASCLGKGRNFPRGQKHEIPLGIAKLRLGCIEVAS